VEGEIGDLQLPIEKVQGL
jgi:hypothetical protein